MPAFLRRRRVLAAIVSIVALTALGALWWFTPVELRIEVAGPEATRAHGMAIAVLAVDARGVAKIAAEKSTAHPDDRTFRLRVPRGTYRVVVEVDDAAPFDETLRVLGATTFPVRLRSQPGRHGSLTNIP